MDEADQKLAALSRAMESPSQRLASQPPLAPSSASPMSIVADAAPSSDVPEGGIEDEPIDPRHERIYELADQGRGPQEIADQLSQPYGEVLLILALRRQSASFISDGSIGHKSFI